MTRPLTTVLALSALMGAAFVAGAWLAPRPALAAQGRGPDKPIVKPPVEAPKPSEPLVYGGDSGQAAAANGVIAVTGSYGVGQSVLYLVDTVNKQLAVYEARGGAPSTRRLVLVGARKIDLDLRLEGYNDESEYSYETLRKLFEQRGAGAVSRPRAVDATEGGR